MPESLQLTIRTPHERVVQQRVAAARVPTETGLVGLRPHQEPLVLAVEPGLIIMRAASGDESFAATAGGLLESGRGECTLYTPFAVVSDSEEEMRGVLERMLSTPPSELLARRRLEELEQRIVGELTKRPRSAPRVDKRHG